MPLSNSEIAAVFGELADLLEIDGKNPFRIRAFRRAAQTLESLAEPAASLIAAGSLAQLPGIGEGAVTRISELLDSGRCRELETLHQRLPGGLLELLRIEGLGPKTVRLVFSELGITTVDALEAAAAAGHLAGLPRMGERSQAKLLQAIEAYRRRRGRILLGEALPQGLALVEALAAEPTVEAVELAGSVRRRRETIGDLDLLAASSDPAAVMDAFAGLAQVGQVMLRGETKCSVKLTSGLQVDLRVVAQESFGAALHYFTGSQHHNIALRDRAKRQGLRLNEYGVFEEKRGLQLPARSEADIFAAVGLPFIPPELREDRGELDAAAMGTLPALISETDLRGELHCHSDASDGSASAEEMARAALALGYEYLAITDHSQSLKIAHGLDPERLRQQIVALRELEQRLGQLRLLCGIEVDILPDGELDLPLALLAELDWVVASVHSHFQQPEEQLTSRVIKALESGVVDCLGHPTGRLLGQREAYALDIERVLRRAAQLGVALELNAFPDRLDLSAEHCRRAKELGTPVAINTDAHDPRHLALRSYGVGTARRGWLEPADVLNTRSHRALQDWREARRQRPR